MRILRCLVVALSSFCAGCVALSGGIGGLDEGVDYYLPKTLLTVAVFEYHDTERGHTWYQIGGIKLTGTNGTLPASTEASYKIEEEIVPDPNLRFTIQYRPSATSDERLCIGRSTSGLLHSVEFASDDRTPKIAFNLARTLAGALSPKDTGFMNLDTPEKIKKRYYSAQIDPFRQEDIDAFNRGLQNMFRAPNLSIDFERARQMIRQAKATWPKGCDENGCPREVWHQLCKPEHICYRTKVKLPLELKIGNKVADLNYANVINPWDIGAISVTRAALVHKVSKFHFEQGALIGMVVRKPSELEELSLMPLNILNAVLITPTGLWANALTGTTEQKLNKLKEEQQLKTELANLQRQYKDIVEGTDQPRAPVVDGDKFYDLKCTAPEGSTGVFNLITSNLIGPGDQE
jgi:hypothetical protein